MTTSPLIAKSRQTLRLLLIATLLASVLTLLFPPSVARAATITIDVDTTTDTNDSAYQVCSDAANDCSLRGAISKANDDPDNDYTIHVPAGTYTLTGAAYDNYNESGDLDVGKAGSPLNYVDLTIQGDGAGSTTIQAGTDETNGVDRVFDVIYTTCSLTLNDVTVRYGRSDSGGGVDNGGTVVLHRCVFSDNTATSSGGGLYNNGTGTLTDSVFSGNSADYGGAIYNAKPLTIERSTMSSNDATSYGGGIYNSGTTRIDDSLFANNHASQGGGVYNNTQQTTLYNSTLSGNSADRGGAIYANLGTTTLVHCTLKDNSATQYAGGAYGDDGATVNAKNTIFAGQASGNYDTCYATGSGTTDSQGYNLVGPVTGCPHDGTGDQIATTSADVGLSALADNGGPTQTHAFSADSLARDAIPDGVNGCGSETTGDQRGVPRPIGGACDVGAFEWGAVVWDGEGSDGAWSTPANWWLDAVPTSEETPIFDVTSDVNATVDSALTLGGLYVGASYGGSIDAGSYDLQISGPYEQFGGGFTAPAGLMTVGGGFAQTGGTFDPNGGRVVLGHTSSHTLTGTFHDLVINDGLLGYWKLDEASGIAAADASGYGHDGTLVGSPTWSSDAADTDFPNPHALSSGGGAGSGDYVNIPNAPAIDELQELTLAAWVKLDSLPAGYMRFVTLGGEKAVVRYDDQALDFYVSVDGSLHHVTVNSSLTSTGTWYHVAGTYDGTTLRVYLNGVEQPGAASVSGTVETGNGVLLSSPDEPLDGLLDDVRVYEYALSSTEIAALANGTHPATSHGTTTLGVALDVSGDLTLNSGTLDVSSDDYGIDLAGSFFRNGGSFDARSGTVTLSGIGTQTLDVSGVSFYDLAVGSDVTLVDLTGLTVSHALTNDGILRRTQDVDDSNTTSFFNTGSYGGLTLYGNGTALGTTTVQIRKGQDCTATPGETVARCFDIAPEHASGQDTTVTFYYASADIPAGQVCSDMNAYHWNGSGWELLTPNARQCGVEPYALTVTGVSSFSPFVLKSGDPPGGTTAVTLVDFSAMAADDGSLLLSWETASEVDLLGFDLYRMDSTGAAPRRLNATLIPGKSSDGLAGASYTWSDGKPAVGGASYWLADIDVHGVATWHGPVMVTTQLPLYLPSVGRPWR